MSSARGTAAVVALCALAAAGCGLGPGAGAGEVELTVTRDYGRETLVSATEEVSESDTVMRLLDAEAEIETRYGGGFVQSIEGISGGSEDGRRLDWFFYVNGIESPVGSAAYEPGDGDRIWWDHRDWTAAMRVPAVVGSYPQPFLGGFEGESWETEVVCVTVAATCGLVAQRLGAAGIEVRTVDGLAASDREAIRVLVGPWGRIRGDAEARLLSEGPERSGVFARFSSSGLELLDEQGETVATSVEAGLVAGLRPGDGPPTWVVTGTDAGSAATLAAPLLESGSLRDRYAIAVTLDRGLAALPLAAGGDG